MESFEVEDGFLPARLDGLGHTVMLAADRFDAENSVLDDLTELTEGVITFHAVQCVVPGDKDLNELKQWSEGDWAIVALSRHIEEQ